MNDVVRPGDSQVARLPSVAVTIVTYNSAQYIARCLTSVFEQDYPALQVIVVDNASTDDSVAQVRRFGSRLKLIESRYNTGFAGGQNLAIRDCHSDWVLVLNPDVNLTPTFVRRLVQAGERDPEVGVVCGKLLSMTGNFEIPPRASFDSAGIFMTPALRHFDRGSRLPDKGQWDREEFVFGATGAAAFYRRRMIDDISFRGEFFDEAFFAYREDADVAWRSQLLGWRCLYAPKAVAHHVRSVLPTNRGQVSSTINMHSVKNRFLLRIKNATPDLYRRFWLPMTLRDLLVIGACLGHERSSLPAFKLVLKSLPKMMAKRRAIMAKKRVSNEYINQWFSFEPIAFPAVPPEGKEMAARKAQCE